MRWERRIPWRNFQDACFGFLPRLRPFRSIIPQSKARKEAHEKIKEDQAGKALVVVVLVPQFFLRRGRSKCCVLLLKWRNAKLQCHCDMYMAIHCLWFVFRGRMACWIEFRVQNNTKMWFWPYVRKLMVKMWMPKLNFLAMTMLCAWFVSRGYTARIECLR